MIDLDRNIDIISCSKNPVKACIVIASSESEEYLDSLLRRAIEKENFRAAQLIFLSMKVIAAHEVNLIEKERCECGFGIVK